MMDRLQGQGVFKNCSLCASFLDFKSQELPQLLKQGKPVNLQKGNELLELNDARGEQRLFNVVQSNIRFYEAQIAKKLMFVLF